ncbi:50S ribosomal protein L23 [candidate division WOR-1 bacterium RIFOXYA12_FULL_43_27]|uniref:Large ribosomal subunit protein uL23 n=1 Tax=candidate division WOR-1 bacterium RIFOXYC2_FULL_46_14 TaxID=1802587 RepID=A0A1F4U5Y9_UNCSA|nr:MAG: 50S ribosomal protein L23 [candidate division WOR-1 bacterium RIFOXYA12_FULL_43_27]OGC20444.1 MAG: 50S ribosomal protein L23 [candidate division WOR-1 bacterium RIFOXYB2_FULL_46_45]OGC31819.1 MAG: 50S ribosomal protein L23 [candidate division WOR-1 bacterium RIFOXYA2_FULL_46_56]OGC40289.1 MAG: 50S ribosomal protein L23 [candidate division WOR-1 bacterium RIFOXYC2_FULL_46_14]
MKNIIVAPIVTEKGLGAAAVNQYVFRVAISAGKIEIKKAIEAIYKVKVAEVNTLKVRGKERRIGRSVGKTSSYKKAYVTLKEGSVIEELKV